MTLDPETLFLGGIRTEMVRSIPWLAPHYIDERGWLRMSFQALLVEAPGLRLIVDTCIGNDKPRSYAALDHLATPFLRQIADAGFPREEVDVVLCTHMHHDHVGWNTMLEGDRWRPTFPRARYLFGRVEYEHWKNETAPQAVDLAALMSDSIRPIFEAGLATLVETDHRISNEISLIPTPGHTPGHVGVLIKSEGRTAIITGDMVHHPCQIAHPDWLIEADSDGATTIKTRARILNGCADGLVLVIGTHFVAPAAGYVHRDRKTYRFAGITSVR